MKYIMMMHCPKTGYDTFASMAKEDLQGHIGYMMRFAKQLKGSGEWVAGEGLASPHEARLVRAVADGEPITDGVFPESKEFLAGYWIIDVENAERAYQLAAHASAAPGVGGAPMNMNIEVRQILSGPPQEFL